MNILLIRPPAIFYPGAVKPLISLPVGILSIAAFLEMESFSVSVYDAQLRVADPVTVADEAIIMGDGWKQVEARVKASEATVVGISCGFSSQLHNAMMVASIVRNSCPDATIIMGGPHASVMPADFLQEGSPVDLVCIGEGEYTMLDVVRAVSSGGATDSIFGTASRCGGRMRINPPRPPIRQLDDLPFPAYHLVDMELYFQLHKVGFADRPMTFLEGSNRAVPVVTSRGCPFNCIFCSIHLHMGRDWRGNSAEYVNRHVKLLVQAYGAKHIHFEDDNITFSRTRFEDIVSGLSPVDITWDTPNGVRVDTLTEEIIEKCKESGCTYLVFGVESGNQRVLDTIVEKRLQLEVVRKAAEWCKCKRLDAMAFYVVGFPGETPADMKETVDFALNLYGQFDVKPHLFVATPLPGTRLEKKLLEAKLIDAPLRSEQLAAMTQGGYRINGGTFTREDIDVLLKKFISGCRRVFVLNTLKYLIIRPASVIRLIMLVGTARGSISLVERLLSALQLKHASLGSRK